MIRSSQEIAYDVEQMLGHGIESGAIHLAGRVREVVSVPAPTRIVVSTGRARHVGFRALANVRPAGTRYVVAATPATPGAPPRVVTGTLRSRVTWQMQSDTLAYVGVFRLHYALALEMRNHKYLVPTLQAELDNLGLIICGRQAA